MAIADEGSAHLCADICMLICHADGTAEFIRLLVDPPLPQVPSANHVPSLFRAALQDDGLRPLPVPDIFFSWNVLRNPILKSYLEPSYQSHAEALAITIGKVLLTDPQPGSEYVQAGEIGLSVDDVGLCIEAIRLDPCSVMLP